MFKIWAKTMIGDKIIKDRLHIFDSKYEAEQLHGYLCEICHELDIPTPVVLKSHIYNFDHFNISRFKKDDFVETVNFDVFVIENVLDKDKKAEKQRTEDYI